MSSEKLMSDTSISAKHTPPIRIVIADDHPIVRDGLVGIVQDQTDMIVVGQASNGTEALLLYRTLLPDVILLDLRMPGMTGVESILAIRQEFPEARAIILSTYDADEDIYRGFQAGAKAYLLKDVGRDVMLETIRAVHVGKTRCHLKWEQSLQDALVMNS